MTADLRFPDFFIVGAAKAGTTSLVDLLRDHRQVFFPHEKEPHHFFLRATDRDWTIQDGARLRPLAQTLPYGDEAAYLSLYDSSPVDVLRGDASTQYLVSTTAAEAIHAQRPDAKIVVVLRDPSERAYSAFVHARSRGEEEQADFAAALDECVSGARANCFATNYLAEGEYDRHIERWKAKFGANVQIILFEDLLNRPQEVLDRLTAFMGVESLPITQQEMSHKNASVELRNPVARALRIGAKRLRRLAPGLMESRVFRAPYEALLSKLGNRPEAIADADKARLKAHYAPHVTRTAELIGRDLSAWL